MKYDNHLFHCSDLPTLMTESRKKGELSKTTQSKLKDLWIAEEFGRKKNITTKYIEKGLLCEQDSLDMFQKVSGTFYRKNTETLSNSFIIGTPDAVGEDEVVDVKSSWDLWTFADIDEKVALDNYGDQMRGYMWLTNKRKSKLCYALNNTPESFIADELYKASFRADAGTEKYKEIENQIRKNMTFDDIEISKRVKIYKIDAMDNDFIKISDSVLLWRDYMNNISL